MARLLSPLAAVVALDSGHGIFGAKLRSGDDASARKGKLTMTVGAAGDLKLPHEIGVEPPSPSVYCRQAEVLEHDGRYEEAIATYGRALALDPGLVAASLAVARLYQWRLGSPRQARTTCLEMLRAGVHPRLCLYAMLAQTFLAESGLEEAEA